MFDFDLQNVEPRAAREHAHNFLTLAQSDGKLVAGTLSDAASGRPTPDTLEALLKHTDCDRGLTQLSFFLDQRGLACAAAFDRLTVEENLTRAAQELVRENMPNRQGAWAIHWEDRQPVLRVLLAEPEARGFRRTDLTALNLLWEHYVTQAFPHDARTVPQRQVLLPVRDLYPSVDNAKLLDLDVRRALCQRAERDAAAVLNREPDSVRIQIVADGPQLAIDYHGLIRPEIFRDELQRHIAHTPERTATPVPVDLTQAFDKIHLRIPGGESYFQNFDQNDMRRLIREAARTAADVDPNRSMLISPYFQNGDLRLTVICNPRLPGQRQQRAIDTGALTRALQQSLVPRIHEFAKRFDSRGRGTVGELGPTCVGYEQPQPQAPQAQRIERVAEPPAPTPALPTPDDRGVAVSLDPEGTAPVRTPDWLRRTPLDHSDVRVVGSANALRTLDSSTRHAIVVQAFNQAYPTFATRGVDSNCYIRDLGGDDLVVRALYPHDMAHEARLALANPANLQRFNFELGRGIEGHLHTPAPLHPAHQAVRHIGAGVSRVSNAWRRVEGLQHVSDDPGRALLNEIHGRLGNPSAVLNLANKAMTVGNTMSRAASVVANLAPPTPVKVAAQLALTAGKIAARLVNQRPSAAPER